MRMTKMKIEKGADEMHAFLELMMGGVQANMGEARKAVDINCEDAMPTALEWVARDAKVIGDLMEKAKGVWNEAGEEEAGEAEVELDAQEKKEVLRVLRLGIERGLEDALEDAACGAFTRAANALQDLGEAMAAASSVFRGMEFEKEEGGEA